jgi:exonuclease III
MMKGRYMAARFGDVTIASLYLPSGSSSMRRKPKKMIFCAIYAACTAMANEKNQSLFVVIGTSPIKI